MLKTFYDKNTKALFQAEKIKDVPPQFRNITKQAWKKLAILDTAPSLKLLGNLLGQKNFKALKGQRKGQYAIRVNDQYRLCFVWGKDNNAYEVELNNHYWD